MPGVGVGQESRSKSGFHGTDIKGPQSNVGFSSEKG